ncbi:MAG TPA: chemotaxis protein CheW [Nitriliruptorales bacterium]
MSLERERAAPRTPDEILRERARSLARTARPEREDLIEAVGFTVSGQRYAAPLRDVVEVVAGSPLARVPHAPASLLGLATVRGSLLAVFALGGPDPDRARPAWMLVLGEGAGQLAIAADELTGADRLDPRELLTADVADLDAAPVTAVTRDGVGLLDVDALLALDRFAVENPTPWDPGSEHP